MLLLLAASALLGLGQAAPTNGSSTLPVVDLGYQLQSASNFNETGGYYNFSNIRYAAPPVASLRFAAPHAPAKNRTHVQSGQDRRICAQADGAWLAIAEQFIPEYLAGQTNFTPASFPAASGSPSIPPQDPDTSEDCLFLDVFVPASVWKNRKIKKVPVLFWIYGGGFTAGDKAVSGSPTGLLERSFDNGEEGVIYVAPNYRLGLFGWLSGQTFKNSGGLPNVGLHDQRFALEWVQKNIHLFGGDSHQVTLFGESAGGSSVEHQITAYGGKGGAAPFQQALTQSPGFAPIPLNSSVQETIYNSFLAVANVTSLAEARSLSFEQLQLVNSEIVGAAPYGSFIFGPVVDGTFVPDLPGTLLATGRYDQCLRVMTGQNTNEGLLFTSPFISQDNATDSLLKQTLFATFPSLASKPDQVQYILQTLYPPVFDGSGPTGYRDRIARASAILSDLIFICNTFYLDKAFDNKTHSYQFAVPPALHGTDIPYTYFTGEANSPASAAVPAPAVAVSLQEYITNFALRGNPNGAGSPNFPVYSDNATVLLLNVTGFVTKRDPAASERCDYWQSAKWT